MESSTQQSTGKKLWHMVRVAYYMLRKGISKQKILMDLHLRKPGQIAGKALANYITFLHQHHASTFYSPCEVQFSCRNTPWFSYFTTTKRKSKYHHHHTHNYDPATVAKAFEFLNSEIGDAEPVAASTSSYLIKDDSEEDSQVDRQAEAFIKRFYEHLSLQQQVASTPEYGCHRPADLVGLA